MQDTDLSRRLAELGALAILGAQHIAQQRRTIVNLEQSGQDASEARERLAKLTTQQLRVAEEIEKIRRRLAAASARTR